MNPQCIGQAFASAFFFMHNVSDILDELSMGDIRDVNTMRTILSIQMVYMVCAPSMGMLAKGEAKFMFSLKIDYKALWHKISP